MTKVRIAFRITTLAHIRYNDMWDMITTVADEEQTVKQLKENISHITEVVGGKYEANDNDEIHMLIVANEPDMCKRFYELVDQLLDETDLDRQFYGACFSPDAMDYLQEKLEGFIVETNHGETFTTIEFAEGAFEMLENIVINA